MTDPFDPMDDPIFDEVVTDESALPEVTEDDLPEEDRKEVPAPELSEDEKNASDEQDQELKTAMSRRGASENTDDENLLGLVPGDTED